VTITDPFGTPGPVRDRTDVDPFGIPSDSGRATRTGDTEDRAEIPRDQWGRYLLPQLDGGKPAVNKGYTRVSTTKQALSNTIGIQKWAGRRIVDGLVQDADLNAAAMRARAVVDPKQREQALGKVAEGAYILGGGKERSGLGTEFHEITEDRNKGTLDRGKIDPKWIPELTAYEKLLEVNDIQVLPEYLERVVKCPYNHGGALDNIVRYWNPLTEEWELVIADLKTGRDLDLGWLEILIQLWCYANAEAMWTTTAIERNDPKDPDKITGVQGYYEDMPRDLRTDKALIFHCPLDGSATLYVLDLSGVERYVKAAVEARRANSEAKLKVTALNTYRPDAFVFQPIETRSGVVVVESDSGPVQYPNGVTVYASPRMDEHTAAGARPVCPGDPSHYAEAHNPGGSWFGQPLDHGKTADQLAQEQILAERQQLAAETLARADAMARAEGRNDDDDEAPAPTHDPVTGRKKRTCGHCHKPGHTQKNCPENPASPKYVPPLATAAALQDPPPEPAGDPAPDNDCNCHNDGDWHPRGSGGCLLAPLALAQANQAGAEQPYCTLPHVCRWSANHPDAMGQWVCSESGKPGKAAWERKQTKVTADSPSYGHPDGDRVTHLNPPPPAEPSPWAGVQAPDMVAWAISNATDSGALLKHRADSMTAGTWTPEHDNTARIKYGELTAIGK
jgi:hypothetical protein